MRVSISRLKTKIKSHITHHGDQLYVVGIIIGTAVLSFALGRLSVEKPLDTVQIAYPEEIVARAQKSLEQNREVVASSQGTRYYYTWCKNTYRRW